MGLLGKRRGTVAKGVGQPAASGSDLIGGSLSKDDHYYIQEAFGIAVAEPAPAGFVATGGTKVSTPTHILHVFTSPGTFAVSSGTMDVDYLLVGGGGSGGGRSPVPTGGVTASGGGGAGGLLSSFPEGPGGPSPTSAASKPVSEGDNFAVTIGAGGVGGPANPPSYGAPGGNSSIAFPGGTETATGGGEGGMWNQQDSAEDGGSGGGGGYSESPTNMNAGDGAAGQGYPGGYGIQATCGGGGGAGSTGGNGVKTPTWVAGAGGDGKGFANIPPSYGTPGPSPTLRYFAGGGGGGSEGTNGGAASYGGGGKGSQITPNVEGDDGTANTGGGGGGGNNTYGPPGIKSGGSGIAIIRYPA